MKPRKKSDRQIDYLAAARDDARLAPEPAAAMPLQEIVPLHPRAFPSLFEPAARSSLRRFCPRIPIATLSKF
jgi:hypothetical protein